MNYFYEYKFDFIVYCDLKFRWVLWVIDYIEFCFERSESSDDFQLVKRVVLFMSCEVQVGLNYCVVQDYFVFFVYGKKIFILKECLGGVVF